jgi:hypothetical protein
VPHAKVCIEEPDVHLYLMSKAKHLLLHLGGFSMIGGLVATGKVYITREIGCLASPLWKEDTKEKNFVYLR